MAPPREGLPPGLEIYKGQIRPIPIPFEWNEGATGIQRDFAKPVLRPDNPTTPERVALGRLLFFDPILAGDNSMSCAHCHHPNLGFSDGLPRALGFGSSGAGAVRGGGIRLPRRTPSLWNALYNPRQYWDGRARDLEDQAQFPITDPHEMNSKRDVVVSKIQAVPEYRSLFSKAFGGPVEQTITFENVTKALAAFERTLVSRNSRYDRYAAGDSSALTDSEKRGLRIFLSTKTRCVECHSLPLFSNGEFKVNGVLDTKDGEPDPHKPNAAPGMGGGPNGMFKVPSLRNVALRAPYMHNGSLATLDDVLEFYEHDGGRGRGANVPRQDSNLRKFRYQPGEKTDLIAFMNSLTDTSAVPQIPRKVPSGLPVIPHVKMRFQLTEQPIPPTSPPPAVSKSRQRPVFRGTKVVEVHPGESIQQAIEKAGRGGTIKIYPGIYQESLLIVNHDVTLEGVKSGDENVVLEGGRNLTNAIIVMGNRVVLQNLTFRNYQESVVVARQVKDLVLKCLNCDQFNRDAFTLKKCSHVKVVRCGFRIE